MLDILVPAKLKKIGLAGFHWQVNTAPFSHFCRSKAKSEAGRVVDLLCYAEHFPAYDQGYFGSSVPTMLFTTLAIVNLIYFF